MSSSGISWAICKTAPRSRQITTPAPHHSVFYRPDALPAAQPTASKHWRQQTYLVSASFFSWADRNIHWSDLTRIRRAACRWRRRPGPTWAGSPPVSRGWGRRPGRRWGEEWTTSSRTGRSVCVRSCRTISVATATGTASPGHPWLCICQLTLQHKKKIADRGTFSQRLYHSPERFYLHDVSPSANFCGCYSSWLINWLIRRRKILTYQKIVRYD